MKDNLVLGYWLLSIVPAWAIVPLLWLFTVEAMRSGRYLIEKLGYNFSMASMIGDMLLAASIAMNADVLHQHGLSPGLLTNVWWQIGWISIATVAAIKGILTSGQEKWMDIYHNVLIMPLYIYLMGITLLVPFLDGGLLYQKVLELGCFGGWLILLCNDNFAGRLNQSEQLVKLGLQKTVGYL